FSANTLPVSSFVFSSPAVTTYTTRPITTSFGETATISSANAFRFGRGCACASMGFGSRQLRIGLGSLSRKIGGEGDMAVMTVVDIKKAIRGGVIQPGDPDYEEARKVYNAMIDKRPAMIARCLDAADVITALAYARGAKLNVA